MNTMTEQSKREFPGRSQIPRRLAGLAFCLSILGMAWVSGAEAQERLQWSITPYLWATDTKVDLRLDGEPIGGDEIAFDDLLDVLDTAFMVHVEAGKGHWSAFGDLTYLETSETNVREVLTIDSDSEQAFFDAAAGWWPQGVGRGLNLYGGIRYARFDDRYRFRLDEELLAEHRNDVDYTDALIGVRYLFDLSERWSLQTRADTSFGDSEGTWLLRAQLAWTVGKRRQNQFILGYELKEAEYDDNGVRARYRYSGPTAGFNFRF